MNERQEDKFCVETMQRDDDNTDSTRLKVIAGISRPFHKHLKLLEYAIFEII